MPTFLVHALAALALTPVATAQWPSSSGPVTPEVAAADNRFLSGITRDHPGGVLLVDKGSQVVLERAYGAAELVEATPNTSSTLFRVQASRACAVRLLAVRLARAGELSLDDRVAETLPALSDTAVKTTIGDLVADRARYLSLENLLHFRRRNERGTISMEGALAALGRTRSSADLPHRSTNTLVLIAAMEAATDSTIDELVNPHLFVPGGMESALWDREVGGAPENSAINYKRRRRDEDWREERASPLTANGGWLWLSAWDTHGLCRLVLKEEDPSSLAQGMLQIADRGHLGLSKGECAVFFEGVDRLTVWASNDRGTSSRCLPHSIGSSLVGLKYNGAFLGVGGGAGIRYGGTSKTTRYAGRWPVGTYEIFELEQSLILTQDARGKLLASAPGFEPTIVYFGHKELPDDAFEGTISRSSEVGLSPFKNSHTGTHLMKTERDVVTIRFLVNATGVPEPVSVSLQTSGDESKTLNDLFLVPPPR